MLIGIIVVSILSFIAMGWAIWDNDGCNVSKVKDYHG